MGNEKENEKRETKKNFLSVMFMLSVCKFNIDPGVSNIRSKEGVFRGHPRPKSHRGRLRHKAFELLIT